jgi:hypothetical protein
LGQEPYVLLWRAVRCGEPDASRIPIIRVSAKW